MTQLSPHFSLAEMTHTSVKADNTPTPEHLENLKRTARLMEAVRQILGDKPIKVNSAYRSPKVNAVIGGAHGSHHTMGYAVDFTCKGFGTPYQVAMAIVKSGLKFDQLILEKDTWVHISFKTPMRNQCLTLKRGARKYSAGIVK